MFLTETYDKLYDHVEQQCKTHFHHRNYLKYHRNQSIFMNKLIEIENNEGNSNNFYLFP